MSLTKRRKYADVEEVRKLNYLLKAQVVGDQISRGELSCPKCGGKKLVWECCGIEVADPEIIVKLREEVKVKHNE